MPEYLLSPIENPGRKRSIWVPTMVLVVVAAGCSLGIRLAESSVQSRILMFDQSQAKWRQLPSPGKYASELLLDGAGEAWGVSVLGLSHWNGRAWQAFRSAELGLKNTVPHGPVALDGREVWAVTREGVVHWDGKIWQNYPEVATPNATSIVAANGEVWLMDSARRLSHFLDGQWETHKVGLPGGNPTKTDPALALTSDGGLWLVWAGLWRLHGWKWEAITTDSYDLSETRLVGSSGDQIWLWDSEDLRAVASDGKTWQVFPASRSGIPENAGVFGLASDKDHTWFASTAGLFDWNGSGWRKLPLPSTGNAGVGKIAAAPDGTLWAIGLPAVNSLETFRQLVPLVMLSPIALIAIGGMAFARLNRRRIYQHKRAREAVHYATGEIPFGFERGEKRLSLKRRAGYAMVFAGAVVAFILLRRSWPDAPLWTAPLIAPAMHLAFNLLRSLVKRKPQGDLVDGSHPRFDWAKTGKIFAGGLLLLMFYNADRLPRLSLVRGFAIWVVLLAPIGYHAFMLHLMEKARREGDYDRALTVIRRFHFYNPNGMLPMRLGGQILLQAGRFSEAEQMLRKGLGSSLGGEDYGFALEHLGDTFLELGRLDEARRSYEAALHAVVWLRRPYRGLAEMLLRDGSDPEDALAIVERILNQSGMSWRERKAQGHVEQDYWSLKGWALAAAGREAEVLPAIENAVKSVDRKNRPDLAIVHYRAGMAMQTLGHYSTAKRHFDLASELDPHGRWGTLARQAKEDCVTLESLTWEAVRA